MSGQEFASERDTVQEGVLAAVIRVASVSAPGTRELVLEYAAASEAISCGTQERLNCKFLADAFCDGLSADALRRLVGHETYDNERLAPLLHGVALITDRHGNDLAHYQELVLKAADAAARTQTGSGLLSGRVTYLEKVAINEIRSVLGIDAIE